MSTTCVYQRVPLEHHLTLENPASSPLTTDGPILTTTFANPPSTRTYTTVATVSGSEVFSIVTETSLAPTSTGGAGPGTGVGDENEGTSGGTSSGTATGVEGETTGNSMPGNSFMLKSGVGVRVGIITSGLVLGFGVAL